MAATATKSILSAVLVVLASCSAPPVADLRGVWGGTHIGLTITDENSRLEFDCAAGAIPRAFEVDTRGYLRILVAHILPALADRIQSSRRHPFPLAISDAFQAKTCT